MGEQAVVTPWTNVQRHSGNSKALGKASRVGGWELGLSSSEALPPTSLVEGPSALTAEGVQRLATPPLGPPTLSPVTPVRLPHPPGPRFISTTGQGLGQLTLS